MPKHDFVERARHRRPRAFCGDVIHNLVKLFRPSKCPHPLLPPIRGAEDLPADLTCPSPVPGLDDVLNPQLTDPPLLFFCRRVHVPHAVRDGCRVVIKVIGALGVLRRCWGNVGRRRRDFGVLVNQLPCFLVLAAFQEPCQMVGQIPPRRENAVVRTENKDLCARLNEVRMHRAASSSGHRAWDVGFGGAVAAFAPDARRGAKEGHRVQGSVQHITAKARERLEGATGRHGGGDILGGQDAEMVVI